MEFSDLITIDVETSGVNPYEHSILSVALVPVVRSVPGRSWFIRHPGGPVRWTDVGREYFERYRTEWESRAAAPDVVADEIAKWLDGFAAEQLMLVGHNIGFDTAFLRQLSPVFPKLSHRCIDTHTLLCSLYWQGKVPAEACTSSGAFRHFGIEPPPEQRHTALGDADATRRLFLKLRLLQDDLRSGPARTVKRS